MNGLQLRSPAKLNLILDVLGKRPDGYHDINSIVTGLDFCDDMSFQVCPETGCELLCNRPELPLDDGNLVVRAANLLAQQTQIRLGCRIRLEKRIPIGGGMGGGSSNAATTLEALNRLWNCGLTSYELMTLGTRLGSDVPLFFRLPSAQISGWGEVVAPIELAWAGWFVLMTAGIEVSTSEVYRAWSAQDRSAAPSFDETVIRAARSARQLATVMFNGLEPAIGRVCPAMEELRTRVESQFARPARITGAGGVVFLVCDQEDEADRILGEIGQLDHGLTAWKARPLMQPAWQL